MFLLVFLFFVFFPKTGFLVLTVMAFPIGAHILNEHRRLAIKKQKVSYRKKCILKKRLNENEKHEMKLTFDTNLVNRFQHCQTNLTPERNS